MKNKVKNSLAITAFAILIFIGCVKKNEKLAPNSTDSEILNTPPAPPDIDKQMKWIAKGYAKTLHNSTNRSLWESYLSLKDFNEEKHAVTTPYFISNNAIDFDDEIKQAIDNLHPVNDYNQSFYQGFTINTCYYSTGLRLIDPDLVNLNYRVVWQPFANSGSEKDSFWGYYINGSGTLDSTLLTDDNYDDYSVFVVFVTSDCDRGGASAPKGCNENEICEPMKGETPQNCTDCKNAKQPGEYDLEVLSVTLKKDDHMFDEAWIEGRYEIDWNWMITSGNNGIVSLNRSLAQDNLEYNDWKRNELVRCKKNGSKCKGTATSKPCLQGSLMYGYFNPSVNSVLIHFHENQPERGGGVHSITPEINQAPINFSAASGFDNDFNISCKSNFGTFHTVQGPGNNGPGVIYVPAGSAWTTELINGVNYKTTVRSTPALGGVEIDVKLGYKI